RVGAKLERFLAPVDPGTLLLLGYYGDTPILSAPCCFRSAKPNVVDLLLPPMLARYRVSAWEVAGLGHGGLLSWITPPQTLCEPPIRSKNSGRGAHALRPLFAPIPGRPPLPH